MDRLNATSEIATGNYTVGGAVEFERFRPKAAKDLFDAVDRALAREYALTEEELDFIVNYDIKYRMGETRHEKES
jgi:hypothetical protein